MKNYISIAALLAAGTLVSNAASVIYDGAPDGGVSPTSYNEIFVEYEYFLASSGDYQNLKIQAGSSDSYVEVTVSDSTVSGVTIENNSQYGMIHLVLTGSTLSGKVSSTSGSDSMGNGISMDGTTTFLTGTSFELGGSSDCLVFFPTGTITWNLSEDDVKSEKALVSVANQDNGVFIDSASIVLNFVNEAAIQAAAAKSETFWLFEEGTKLNGADASQFSIQLAGKEAVGYDLSVDVSTGKVSVTAVPEPSAFGLLAGLGALALVASRRRRTKRA